MGSIPSSSQKEILAPGGFRFYSGKSAAIFFSCIYKLHKMNFRTVCHIGTLILHPQEGKMSLGIIFIGF